MTTRRRNARAATMGLCGALTAMMPALAPPVAAQSIEEKAEVCSACHGEQGMPQEKTTPIIWGQHTGYTYIQLRDYKRGTRQNEQMTPIVQDMDRAEMLALAEYFAKKPWPRNLQKAAGDDVALRAQRASTAGQCSECHLARYAGDGTIPRLTGQQYEYLLATMLAFKTRERKNNPAMTDLMRLFPDEDIEALARYVAGL